MNSYLIQYKISSMATLIKDFSYEGYDFSAYDIQEPWKDDVWVASKTVETNTAGEARRNFINGLLPLMQEFSLVSQCAFRFVANTYVIYKLNNNEEKVFYVYFVQGTEPVGLHFDTEEISKLFQIREIENNQSLFFLNEAANATTFYTKLTMLILVVEGLAGEIEDKRGFKLTNRTKTKEILGNDLDEKLFASRIGLRNILFHGKVKDHQPFEGLSEVIYSKIREWLSSKYNINLETSIVDPQRNFHENYVETHNYWQFKKKVILNLKTIEEAMTDSSKERKLFSLFTGDTRKY